MERLGEIQKELLSTVQELNKSQKSYKEDQHVTFEARLKASAADTKYIVLIISSHFFYHM